MLRVTKKKKKIIITKVVYFISEWNWGSRQLLTPYCCWPKACTPFILLCCVQSILFSFGCPSYSTDCCVRLKELDIEADTGASYTFLDTDIRPVPICSLQEIHIDKWNCYKTKKKKRNEKPNKHVFTVQKTKLNFPR